MSSGTAVLGLSGAWASVTLCLLGAWSFQRSISPAPLFQCSTSVELVSSDAQPLRRRRPPLPRYSASYFWRSPSPALSFSSALCSALQVLGPSGTRSGAWPTPALCIRSIQALSFSGAPPLRHSASASLEALRRLTTLRRLVSLRHSPTEALSLAGISSALLLWCSFAQILGFSSTWPLRRCAIFALHLSHAEPLHR